MRVASIAGHWKKPAFHLLILCSQHEWHGWFWKSHFSPFGYVPLTIASTLGTLLMLVSQKTDSMFRYNPFQMRFHFVGIAIISYSTRHEQLFYSIFAYAFECFSNGLLTRYRKCRVVHAHGMPGTFPRHRELEIPTCTTGARRTCRDACRDR